MNELWILEFGYDYEGTEIKGVFSSEEKALEAKKENYPEFTTTDDYEYYTDPERSSCYILMTNVELNKFYG